MQDNEAVLVLFYNTVTKNVNSYILSKWPPGALIWKYLLPDRGVIYSQRILQFHLPWIHSTSSEWLSVEYYYNLCVSLHSFTLVSLQLLEPRIPLKTDKMTRNRNFRQSCTNTEMMPNRCIKVWLLPFTSPFLHVMFRCAQLKLKLPL